MACACVFRPQASGYPTYGAGKRFVRYCTLLAIATIATNDDGGCENEIIQYTTAQVCQSGQCAKPRAFRVPTTAQRVR